MEDAPEPVLTVQVIGPVVISGLRDPSRRRGIEELCAYLTLNAGRDVSSDELRSALGGAEKEWSASTLHSRVSNLRAAVGRDVLIKSGKAGYVLSGEVTCDWLSFRELTAPGVVDEEVRIARLERALGLVRGVPFAGVAAGQYTWALEGPLVGEISAAVEAAALELATLLTERGEARRAAQAARAGLRALPYSFGLLAALLRAGAVDGRIGLEGAWRQVAAVAGDDEELRRLKERLEVEIVGS